MSTETTETPTQRLERLRAETAERKEAASAKAEESITATPGSWMHSLDESGVAILRSTSIFGAPSTVLYRGDELQIDAAMLEADRDRHGRPSWSALLHDEEAQIQKWGAVRLRAGRAPHDLQPWVHGSTQWAEAREAARRAAWGETDPQRRAAALQRVNEVYGNAPTTSTVHATYTGDVEYQKQEAAIAASAAAGVPNLSGGAS